MDAAEPKYALGLLAAKADRLLSHERPLLYWPLYRQSVLPAESRVLGWFTRHRTGVERVVDWFWYVLIAAALVGVSRRSRAATGPRTSLLPMPLALAALYTLFFAEARYHLAIAVLLMPFAGAGLVWVGEAVRDLARFTIDRQRRPRLPIEACWSPAWPSRCCSSAGRACWRRGDAPARPQHRWAAAACTVDGRTAACARSAPRAGAGRSRRRCAASGTVSGFASTPPARRPPRRRTSTCPPASTASRCASDCGEPLSGGRREVAAERRAAPSSRRMPWPAPGSTVALVVPVTHAPAANCTSKSESTEKICTVTADVAALWMSAFEVETRTHVDA